MRNFFSQKKFLLLALLEDVLMIFFLCTLIASGLEILLPGVLAHTVPLALLFTIFAFLTLLYTQWIQKERLSYPNFSIPTALFVSLTILLVLVALFMTRAFGIWGALIQVALIGLALFIWLAPLEKKILANRSKDTKTSKRNTV